MLRRSEIRNVEEDLQELDEADRAIERLRQRIRAQEQRLLQLEQDGIDSQSAERILGNLCDSLRELVRHRALIPHASTDEE